MTYKHGVYSSEVPTGLLPPVSVDSAVPFVVGTAPVHMLEDGIGPVEEVTLISSYSEAVSTFGYSDDWEKYSLCEFVKSHFALFAVCPILFVNVFDPSVHQTEVGAADFKFSSDEVELSPGIIDGSVEIKSKDVTPVTFVMGEDYDVDLINGKIIRISTGSIVSDADVSIAFTVGDPSKVTEFDIIGGVDSESGKLKGLELVNGTYPKYRTLPGLIVSPGWSHKPAVAAVMTAKAKSINQIFSCLALIDLDDSVVKKYSDAPAEKNSKNFMDPAQIVCWPKVKLGSETFHLSTQIAGLIARTDSENSGVPYVSPSNHNLQIDSCVADGETVWLQLEQANYLNGQGIVTALNFSGGWKLWGNRTACYPANTDPKDAWICTRRMFKWIGNTLILTFWSKIDAPANRRLIETILGSAQMWLDGLVARQFLLGATVEFRSDENSVLDLMDGVQKFHVLMTPPSPARDIEFIQEYDPANFEAVFK
ncbi:MAG: phage tail sheath family protein [Desulfobacterales bacterium]|nr:phage tail sheath family protein [Desulfobacterales bacterium]